PRSQRRWRRVATDLRSRRARLLRRCASSSRRPPWSLDGRCRLGRCGRRRGPTTIKRRRLLDGAPVFLILRDHRRYGLLVAVVSAALLDADLGHEGHAIELAEADGATCACFGTLVIGIEAERAIENCFKLAESDLSGLGMAISGALQNPVLEKLLALVRPVSDGQHNGKHLAAAVLAAREHPILADTARSDVYDEGGLGPLWDLRFEFRCRYIGVVVGHKPSPMFERAARVKRCGKACADRGQLASRSTRQGSAVRAVRAGRNGLSPESSNCLGCRQRRAPACDRRNRSTAWG